MPTIIERKRDSITGRYSPAPHAAEMNSNVKDVKLDKGEELSAFGVLMNNGEGEGPGDHLITDTLNYEVSKRPLLRYDGKTLDGWFSMVNNSNGNVIGEHSVGRQFTPVQPKVVGQQILDAVHGLGCQYHVESVGAFKNGGLIFVNVKLDSFKVEGDKSPMYNRILFADPMTEGSLRVAGNNYRVFCANCLNATLSIGARGGNNIHLIHTPGIQDNVDHIIRGAAEQIATNRSFAELANLLCAKQIDSNGVKYVLDEAVPLFNYNGTPKEGRAATIANDERDRIMSNFTGDDTMRKGSAWAFLNSYTNMLDHSERGRIHDETERMVDNLIGIRAQRKRVFINATMEAVGVATHAA